MMMMVLRSGNRNLPYRSGILLHAAVAVIVSLHSERALLRYVDAFSLFHRHQRSSLQNIPPRNEKPNSPLAYSYISDHDAFHNIGLEKEKSAQSTGRRKLLAQLFWTATSLVGATTTNPGIVQAKESQQNSTPDPELSSAAQRLYDLDRPNRLKPNQDYVLNIQATKKPSARGDDVAPDLLFRYVDCNILNNRPTYQRFIALLNNYNAQSCAIEDVTQEEVDEAYAFPRGVVKTPVMQFCYRYCRQRVPDKVPETEEAFIKLLYNIWFKPYRRCNDVTSGSGEVEIATAGSSGFEHVFVGEIKDGKVSGFHNWIQIYLQESMGKID